MEVRKQPLSWITVADASVILDMPEDVLRTLMSNGLIPVLPSPQPDGQSEDHELPPPWDIIDRLRRRGL